MYADVNVLVHAIFEAGEIGQKSRELLKKNRLVTSVLTIDELMWVVRREKGKEYIASTVKTAYNIPTMKIVGVGAHLAKKAVEIIEQHNLKPRDAMHVAMMKELGETEIISTDPDFDRVSGIKRVKL
jgi:predicted nucleic acid-binding protein